MAPNPQAGSNLPIHTIDIKPESGLGGKAQPGAQHPALPTSSFSAVWLWHGNGQVTLNLSHSQITARSRVLVSASEYSTAWDIDRFIGSASVQVLNVSPYNGGVRISLSVSWGTPLNIAISAFIDP